MSFADEDRSNKGSAVGNTSLQPIKEVVAIVAREASQRQSSATEKVVYEDEAKSLEDSHVCNAAPTHAASDSQQPEQFSSDVGPLEQGMLTGGSLKAEDAIGKLSTKILEKPPQGALPQGEHAIANANSLAVNAFLDDSHKMGRKQLDRGEEEGEEMGRHQALTPGTEIYNPSKGRELSEVFKELPSDQQQEMREEKVVSDDDEHEAELLDEISSLSEQAMTKTLVSQSDSEGRGGYLRV